MAWYSDNYKRKNIEKFGGKKLSEINSDQKSHIKSYLSDEYSKKPSQQKINDFLPKSSSSNDVDEIKDFKPKPLLPGGTVSKFYNSESVKKIEKTPLITYKQDESQHEPFVVKKIEEKPKLNLNKIYIVLGTILILVIILASLYFFTKPTIMKKYNYLDVVVSNVTSLPSSIYFKNKYIFQLSGFETQLKYNNNTDRLFGNEEYKKIIFDDSGKAYTITKLDKEIIIEPLTTDPNKVARIGWFTDPSKIKTTEKTKSNNKFVSVLLSDDNTSISSAKIDYVFYKNKPYFKIQLNANADSVENLQLLSYGFILKDFDIYLSNSTILYNDNNITSVDQTREVALYNNSNRTLLNEGPLYDSVAKTEDINRKVRIRTGSNYEIKDSDYQMFVKKDKTLAIVVFSPDVLSFKDYFYWNVFQTTVPIIENSSFYPLYIIVIENPILSYDSDLGDWNIKSSQYQGYLKYYIDESVFNMEK